MFFILSKTAFYLLMPMTWIVGLLLYALLTKLEHRRKLSLKGVVVLLFVLGNNFLVNEAIRWWEVPVTPIRQLPGSYDVAVILTGVTDTERKPNDRVYFMRGADRVLHPLQLFKVGKVKHFSSAAARATWWAARRAKPKNWPPYCALRECRATALRWKTSHATRARTPFFRPGCLEKSFRASRTCW
jgi:hypothetical protein